MKNDINAIALEKGMSAFEIFLRKIPVEVNHLFLDDDGNMTPVSFEKTGEILSTPDADKINQEFKNTVKLHGNAVLKGVKKENAQFLKNQKVLVLFSGGPAAGGNNVIVGIHKVLGTENQLFGVKAGPGGLVKGDTFPITEENIQMIINMGGFDFLGSDRTKIEDLSQFEKVKNVCREQKINAIIIVGGDDSNTNAAILAETLFSNVHEDGSGVRVIGVPKTIDGDLQLGKLLPISFGYDTAVKIYAEMVGNIAQDTPSSRKYYHFVKIMGRSASHVALGVALKIRPTITLISEEIYDKNYSLDDIIEGIAQTIALRSARGIKHGVVLVPEGLIEFIPEIKTLISDLNKTISLNKDELSLLDTASKKSFISQKLSKDSYKTLHSLPESFRDMLLLERDEHGNLPVSQIKTEELLIALCTDKIIDMKQNPEQHACLKKFSESELETFKKFKFSSLAHFLGYEGRCGAPSKFDMSFAINLGAVAGSLVLGGQTGFVAAVSDLDKGGSLIAIPLTGNINYEDRGSKLKPVIKKAIVEQDSPAFHFLKKYRKQWAMNDYFHSSGPRQYAGPKEVTDVMPFTVFLNQNYTSNIYNMGRETKIHKDKYDKLNKVLKELGVSFNENRLYNDGTEFLKYPVILQFEIRIGQITFNAGDKLVINELGEIFKVTGPSDKHDNLDKQDGPIYSSIRRRKSDSLF